MGHCVYVDFLYSLYCFFSLFIYLFVCLRCNVGVMANYTQDYFKRGVAGFPARSCHLYIYLTKISIRLWKISPILSRVVVAFDDFLQCVYSKQRCISTSCQKSNRCKTFVYGCACMCVAYVQIGCSRTPIYE